MLRLLCGLCCAYGEEEEVEEKNVICKSPVMIGFASLSHSLADIPFRLSTSFISFHIFLLLLLVRLLYYIINGINFIFLIKKLRDEQTGFSHERGN